jgi:hypothetical protein
MLSYAITQTRYNTISSHLGSWNLMKKRRSLKSIDSIGPSPPRCRGGFRFRTRHLVVVGNGHLVAKKGTWKITGSPDPQTVLHDSDIVSDIPSGRFWKYKSHIYSDSLSGILSDILSGVWGPAVPTFGARGQRRVRGRQASSDKI